jgi:hypothetical protein
MRRIFANASTLLLVLGIAGTVFGLWDIVRKSGINKEAQSIYVNDLESFDGNLLYAHIEGGRLDLSNSYEYSLSTRGRNVNLTSTFFTPVLNDENSHLAYIIATDAQPTYNDMLLQADYTGLLQTRSELPGSVRARYADKFPNARMFYLDTTYRPQQAIERLLELRLFLGLTLVGLATKLSLTRSGNTEMLARRKTERHA